MPTLLGLELTTHMLVITTLCVWFRNPIIWRLSLSITLLVALAVGSLSAIAVLPVVVTAVLLVVYSRASDAAAWFCLCALAILGLAFGLHVLPGFENHAFLQAYQLNAASAPFSIWFNYDKALFGLLVFGLLFHDGVIRGWAEFKDFVLRVRWLLVLGIAGVYAVGLGIGYAQFDWTPSMVFWPWVLKNLFFTVIAEEMLFRGLIQQHLARSFSSKSGQHLAVVIAALLFGFAHIAGGWSYVLLSTLAGLVYGYSFKISGKIEGAIAAHLLLNVVHFLCFSYPYSLS